MSSIDQMSQPQRPHRRGPRRRSKLALRTLTALLIITLVIFFGGFLHFVSNLPEGPPVNARGEAIVVLTGGDDRIAAGMSLLADGHGEHMLISGVNHQTDRHDIRELIDPRHRDNFDCCVDLGKAARDTTGNAIESITWVDSNGYKKIILVTAYYHMPRSLAEMQNADPSIRVIAYPVFPEGIKAEGWWIHPKSARLLMTEYLKYLVALARFRLDLD